MPDEVPLPRGRQLLLLAIGVFFGAGLAGILAMVLPGVAVPEPPGTTDAIQLEEHRAASAEPAYEWFAYGHVRRALDWQHYSSIFIFAEAMLLPPIAIGFALWQFHEGAKAKYRRTDAHNANVRRYIDGLHAQATIQATGAFGVPSVSPMAGGAPMVGGAPVVTGAPMVGAPMVGAPTAFPGVNPPTWPTPTPGTVTVTGGFPGAPGVSPTPMGWPTPGMPSPYGTPGMPYDPASLGFLRMNAGALSFEFSTRSLAIVLIFVALAYHILYLQFIYPIAYLPELRGTTDPNAAAVATGGSAPAAPTAGAGAGAAPTITITAPETSADLLQKLKPPENKAP